MEPIKAETIYAALRDVFDPEIPVNIVELGLVYDVTIVDDWVGVKMTLTTQGCGMANQITDQVRRTILAIPGVKDGDVRLVWQPAWTPTMMSEDTRKRLGM
jgi:metal-sulfur cluster biosynthetic enzyme